MLNQLVVDAVTGATDDGFVGVRACVIIGGGKAGGCHGGTEGTAAAETETDGAAVPVTKPLHMPWCQLLISHIQTS